MVLEDYVNVKSKSDFEREKYNNQSRVLLACYPRLSEDDKSYIKRKIGINEMELISYLETYNKKDCDFTIENKIADCILERGVAEYVEESDPHYDEKYDNQSVVLYKSQDQLRGIDSLKIKDIVMKHGYRGAVVEDVYHKIFSNEYKDTNDFRIENEVFDYIKENVGTCVVNETLAKFQEEIKTPLQVRKELEDEFNLVNKGATFEDDKKPDGLFRKIRTTIVNNVLKIKNDKPKVKKSTGGIFKKIKTIFSS